MVLCGLAQICMWAQRGNLHAWRRILDNGGGYLGRWVGTESELAELGLLAVVNSETLEEGVALEPSAEQGRNRSRGGGPARQRRRKRAERAAAEGMAAAEGIAPQRGRQEQGNGAEQICQALFCGHAHIFI